MQRQILSNLVLLVRARGKITHKLFTTKVLPTGYTAWLGKLVEFWPNWQNMDSSDYER